MLGRVELWLSWGCDNINRYKNSLLHKIDKSNYSILQDKSLIFIYKAKSIFNHFKIYKQEILETFSVIFSEGSHFVGHLVSQPVTYQVSKKAQTWKKFIFFRKPIFGFEKYPQIRIVPKHIKVRKIAFIPIISDIF